MDISKYPVIEYFPLSTNLGKYWSIHQPYHHSQILRVMSHVEIKKKLAERDVQTLDRRQLLIASNTTQNSRSNWFSLIYYDLIYHNNAWGCGFNIILTSYHIYYHVIPLIHLFQHCFFTDKTTVTSRPWRISHPHHPVICTSLGAAHRVLCRVPCCRVRSNWRRVVPSWRAKETCLRFRPKCGSLGKNTAPRARNGFRFIECVWK